MSPHRKKSDRKEVSVISDDSRSEKTYSKKKYSHKNSDTPKKVDKHKKSKRESKYSESSDESDGGRDSRKEIKSSGKHKEKTSTEKYESKKNLAKSNRNDYMDGDRDEHRSKYRKYKSDIATEKECYNSKSPQQRSMSQERQKYGKWAEESEWRKDKSSKRDKENSESYSKKDKDRRDIPSEKYRSKNQEDFDAENSESYSKKDKRDRRDIPSEKYRSKNREDFEDESNRNSYRMSSVSERDRYPPNKYKRPKHYVDLDDPNRISKGTDNDVGNEESTSTNLGKNSQKNDEDEPLSKRAKLDNINMRTGGAYIPPGKLRLMQQKIKDKSSEEYQRLAWEALKKSIVGMTNKVNGSNITDIIPELLKENIIRGRGVLARAIMQAQGASPTFTRVYAALVAILNTKFPEIGEVILKRLIIQYKRGFRRNDKTVCTTAARFLAHLLNQEVVHEVLILEMVTHLLDNPTEDSIEIAIAILKECGKKLTQLTPKGMRAMADRVREVLHEGNVDQRVCYMLDVFFAVQKDGFKEFEIVPEELDLVLEEDKFTHLIILDDAVDAQEMLNIFKYDPDYLENEEKYKSVVKEILGDSDKEDESEEESGSGEEDDEEEKKEGSQQIIDMTGTNVVCLRRKVYLTIQSSLDFEECAHKLLKLELKPGQIPEMCYMILDCCAQQRTYEKLFGLLAQRFCQLNKIYVEPFTEIFENSYKTIHRLETNKLRNVAKFFAHLLYTDAISWSVLSIIKLNEEDTTSSSRIFIKILFQELCEFMGLRKLNDRVKDVTLQEAFDGLFPRDHPHNTRFAINFFTSIGLGGLTDELREHLKNLPKTTVLPPVPQEKASSESSSSSSSSPSSSSSSSSSS